MSGRDVPMSGPPFGDPALDEVHADVARYYTAKITKYGPTPLGVDWSCVPTQELRFVQLLKLCEFTPSFLLNDVGCGYGALLAHLGRRHGRAEIDYLGTDLSAPMIRRARRLWRDAAPACVAKMDFVKTSESRRIADYSIASGIFNVCLEQPRELWERSVARTLTGMHATSRRGFAVNFMASPTPGRPPRAGLYGTVPERWVRWCEHELGATVSVLEGYGMREFTLRVHPAA